MDSDQPDSAPVEGSDEPVPADHEPDGLNRNAVLVAGVAVVAVVVIAAVLLFGGGDDGDDVSLSSTTSSVVTTTSSDTSTTIAASTTVAGPTSTEAPTTTTPSEATDPQPPDTTAATPTSARPGSNLPAGVKPIAPDDPRPAPDQPILGEGRVEDPAGLPSVEDIPDELMDVAPATINQRFDAAEASSDPCVKLNALGSFPDLLSLPDLSADEVARYFSRWQTQAGEVSGQVDAELAPVLTSTRVAMSQVQDIVDREGDGRFQEPANGLILNPGTELAALASLSALVGQQCPAPPA